MQEPPLNALLTLTLMQRDMPTLHIRYNMLCSQIYKLHLSLTYSLSLTHSLSLSHTHTHIHGEQKDKCYSTVLYYSRLKQDLSDLELFELDQWRQQGEWESVKKGRHVSKIGRFLRKSALTLSGSFKVTYQYPCVYNNSSLLAKMTTFCSSKHQVPAQVSHSSYFSVTRKNAKL